MDNNMMNYVKTHEIYNNISKYAFIKVAAFGHIGFVLFFSFINSFVLWRIVSVFDFLAYFIVFLPFSVGFGYYLLTIYGYLISDSCIARCQKYRGGWMYISYIRWEDVIRIEYRQASIKTLWFDRITIHSIYGNKILVEDGQQNFQKMLQIIHEKTKMYSKRFVINDSHKIIVFDSLSCRLEDDIHTRRRPFRKDDVRFLPMIKSDG